MDLTTELHLVAGLGAAGLAAPKDSARLRLPGRRPWNLAALVLIGGILGIALGLLIRQSTSLPRGAERLRLSRRGLQLKLKDLGIRYRSDQR